MKSAAAAECLGMYYVGPFLVFLVALPSSKYIPKLTDQLLHPLVLLRILTLLCLTVRHIVVFPADQGNESNQLELIKAQCEDHR